jgi:DNA-binding winged helix-turn-helix (wHTH) protein
MDEETFVFGSFRLIPAQRMLLEDEKPLRLGSRALDILVTLVESAGETIGKDLLIARTWPDTVVDEGALRVHVAALRKALGDGRAGKRYIVNNPGRGYSFAAPVAREQRQPAIAPTNGTAVRGNLPAPLTRIVGRDEIIAALTPQLVPRRFLTIVGPGRIGKTTVAVAVAETVNASYRDGAWFVGLAPLPDPDLVASALARLPARSGCVGLPTKKRLWGYVTASRSRSQRYAYSRPFGPATPPRSSALARTRRKKASLAPCAQHGASNKLSRPNASLHRFLNTARDQPPFDWENSRRARGS